MHKFPTYQPSSLDPVSLHLTKNWLYQSSTDKGPFTPQMRKYGVMRSKKIPTLQLDGHEISESGVISQVIAEKYQVHYSLLGTSDERPEMLQWIAIAETCITFRIRSLPSLMSDRKSLSELRSEVIQPMRRTSTWMLAAHP
jgi:glutathione S-transferase